MKRTAMSAVRMLPTMLVMLCMCVGMQDALGQGWDPAAVYTLDEESVKIRRQPSEASRAVATMRRGDAFRITGEEDGWYQVRFGSKRGYIPDVMMSAWTSANVTTGDAPDCWNYEPMYDVSIPNTLRVVVGGSHDVVVKVMSIERGVCVRYVYIRHGETLTMENFPAGTYRLKLAYGKDWRQSVVDGQCVGRFLEDPIYEIGEHVMNMTPIDRGYEQQIPGYELQLEVRTTDRRNAFRSRKISEAEFNR
jgi:hypothetical protein